MNTHTHIRSRLAGFSLVEVLAVLIVSGVLVSLSSLFLAPMVQNALNARESADLAHRAQLAMARLAREFQTVTNVTSGTSSAIAYEMLDGAGTSRQRSLSWSGTGAPLILNSQTLAPGVQGFALRYIDDSASQSTWSSNASMIEVVIDFGPDGSSYTNRLVSRNLEGRS